MKCEALRANVGRGWSLFAIVKGDKQKYHQCNQPAIVHAVNEYVDLAKGAPNYVWLCAECDTISATQKD